MKVVVVSVRCDEDGGEVVDGGDSSGGAVRDRGGDEGVEVWWCGDDGDEMKMVAYVGGGSHDSWRLLVVVTRWGGGGRLMLGMIDLVDRWWMAAAADSRNLAAKRGDGARYLREG
ncbi:hypothetical protein Tco_0955939 [Tanacetum coccineum]|uniref:Uncharacterized protein n=1 Tax=Tanacetum coccineum TaxID=301880 RepID=A0ABQ5E8K8_9ASTR